MKKLLDQTDFTEYKTTRQTQIDHEEDTRRLHSVAKPEKFRQSWKKTDLLWTDQVPVWLMVDGENRQSVARH